MSGQAQNMGTDEDAAAGNSFAWINVGTSEDTAPTPGKSFTWINVEDQDSTRRVKAVALRDYRRKQKAEAAKFQKRRENAVRRTILSAGPSTKTQTEPPKSKPRPLPIVARIVKPVPNLERQIGNNVDPFNLFPAQLNAHIDRSLAHHYHESFSASPFEFAGHDFSPFREITLRVVMKDPAAFLLLLALSAEHVASISEQDSSIAEAYRAKGLSIINKRMKEPYHAVSDGQISACAVLASSELINGTPETYKIQMDGLDKMLAMRGGFKKVANSSYQLATLIAWNDFAGVAALAGKRRYPFTSLVGDVNPLAPRPPRFSPPLNMPQEPLPPNYTIYEDLLIILDGLSNASLLARMPDTNDQVRRDRHDAFVQGMNDDLMRIRPNVKEKSIPARRFLIEDSVRLGATIYLAAICKSGVDLKTAYELFLAGLASKMGAVTQKTPAWVEATARLVMHLMGGQSVYLEENIANVEKVLDVWATWDFATWTVVRNTFSDFLLYDESCAGPYQDFWKSNMGSETRPIEVV